MFGFRSLYWSTNYINDIIVFKVNIFSRHSTFFGSLNIVTLKNSDRKKIFPKSVVIWAGEGLTQQP